MRRQEKLILFFLMKIEKPFWNIDILFKIKIKKSNKTPENFTTVATATLIPNQTINFNNSNSQKIHFTAKPYIIDNQVQSNGEYSTHSPASSSHSGCPSQVYDRIANINTSTSSSKSLLQPLKSFSNSNSNNHVQSSSVSIPSTPSKHCEAKEFKSPAKKQLIVSLSNSNTASTSVSKPGSNFLMNGKSIENIYDKKYERSDQGMTQEMANLEGIMKDLNAITAKQFEC
ncbi:neogenin-like isoform X3 [Brachionus plicatilis]|uniref:Neogenin-like isoform X3 n=1 Tax=Brachionus plicatilis TaxID=10195 RepID=A0A3M7S226_BRAPC|nr:neogenin-like isoform X3 [Brachionus plicatilis]